MNRVKFKLAPFNSSHDDHGVLINAWTINTVCAHLTAVEVDVKRCDHLRNLQLPDTFPSEASSVDLLVGADQYYKLIQHDVQKGHPGTPIATKSRLGWLLSGPVSESKKSEEVTTMLTVTKIYSSDDQLKHFWELDPIGIVNHQEHLRTVKEEDAVNQFNIPVVLMVSNMKLVFLGRKIIQLLLTTMAKLTKDLFPLKEDWQRI